MPVCSSWVGAADGPLLANPPQAYCQLTTLVASVCSWPPGRPWRSCVHNPRSDAAHLSDERHLLVPHDTFDAVLRPRRHRPCSTAAALPGSCIARQQRRRTAAAAAAVAVAASAVKVMPDAAEVGRAAEPRRMAVATASRSAVVAKSAAGVMKPAMLRVPFRLWCQTFGCGRSIGAAVGSGGSEPGRAKAAARLPRHTGLGASRDHGGSNCGPLLRLLLLPIDARCHVEVPQGRCASGTCRHCHATISS